MKDKNKQNDALTEPKVAVPEPPSSAVIEFDTETFNLSSERAAMFTATRPQGSAAKGYAEKVAKSLDSAKDEIKKKYFGKNKELGDEWEREWLGHRNKKVDDAYQYEVAQVIHGAKVDNDSALARQFSSIVESFDMANAAAFFLTGATIEASGDKFAAKTANMSLRNKDNPIDPNDPNNEAEQAARAQEELDAVNERNKDIETAQTFFNGKIDLARESASTMLAKLHKNQYEHAINVLGYSPEAAGAFANTQIQKNVKKTLQDIVATNPESAKRVLAWLARADATKIQEVNEKGEPVVDKDGKPVYSKTKWNPLGRWCLSQGDVTDLAASAQAQINWWAKQQRLKDTTDEAQRKLYQDRLGELADKWKGEVMLKIANGDLSTMENPNEMLKSLVPEIQKFQQLGYRKTDELLTSLTTACNAYFKRQDDEAKRVAGMTETQRRALLEVRYNELKRSTVDNVTAAFTTPNGKIRTSNGNVERRAALIATIDAMLRDSSTTDEMRTELRAERTRLNSERSERNSRALEMLASRVGWRLPTDQTSMVRNYKQGEYQVIDGAPSYQTSDTLLFKDDGGVIMGADMKARWTDPDNPNDTLELGRNEMRQIFSLVLSAIEETPEDDLTAMMGSKERSRVEVMFLNAMRGAKRAKDSQGVYSAIASGIRGNGDNALFGNLPTSTRRMSYIHDNFVVPPLKVKRK